MLSLATGYVSQHYSVPVPNPEIWRVATGRVSVIRPEVSSGGTVRESPSNQPGATVNPEWLVQRWDMKLCWFVVNGDD